MGVSSCCGGVYGAPGGVVCGDDVGWEEVYFGRRRDEEWLWRSLVDERVRREGDEEMRR